MMINTKDYIDNNIQALKYDRDYLLNHSDNAKEHIDNGIAHGLAVTLVLYRIGFHKIFNYVHYSNKKHRLLIHDKNLNLFGVATPATLLLLFKGLGLC